MISHKATLEIEVKIHGMLQLYVGNKCGLHALDFGDYISQRQSSGSIQVL